MFVQVELGAVVVYPKILGMAILQVELGAVQLGAAFVFESKILERAELLVVVAAAGVAGCCCFFELVVVAALKEAL